MNTGRKVKTGFLAGNMDQWGAVMTTVINLLVPWQRDVSWPLGSLFTRNDHPPSQGSENCMGTGLAYPLEFEVTLICLKIRKTETTQCCPNLEHWFFSFFLVFSKIVLLFSFKKLGNWRQRSADSCCILRHDTLSLSETIQPLFICNCGVFWAITPQVPCRSRSFLYT
jgi:hypothetical protein